MILQKTFWIINISIVYKKKPKINLDYNLVKTEKSNKKKRNLLLSYYKLSYFFLKKNKK